jgi:hypothetical protein
MVLLMTEIGSDLASAGFATGNFPKVAKIKIGDGGGEAVVHTPYDADLINVVYETKVAVGSKEDRVLSIVADIPVDVGGFVIREIGLYTEDNILLAISESCNINKPGMDDPTVLTLHLKMTFGSAQSIGITFSNDSLYATHAMLGATNEIVQGIKDDVAFYIPFIVQPEITYPSHGVENYKGEFICSPYAVKENFSGVLEEVKWQLATDSAFENITAEHTTSTVVPYTPTGLEPNVFYYIRVRHTSDNHNSKWSEPLRFRSKDIDLGDDGLNDLIAGDNITGGYYGVVTNDKLISRDYRGSYKATIAYTANQQVSHANKLWNAVVNVVGVTPGTDLAKWEEDTRNNLPTPKWLLDNIGIGYGRTDGNHDAYSSGSTTIGNLKNQNAGYLKFAKNNKLFYVPKMPLVDTIAWNDIAKRYLVGLNKRTIRIGQRLFYVRLLTEDEYKVCVAGVTDGSLYNFTAAEVGLSERTFIYDDRVGANRYTISGVDNKEDINAKSRVGSYRPVLELIEEYDEPYNNLPTTIPATAENFRYDPYTDTGYFGEVPAGSLFTATQLSTAIGLAAGSIQHDSAGFLKFYYHGMILYMAKRCMRYNLSWDSIKAANAIFGVDLGGTGKSTVTKNGISFSVAIPIGSSKSPSDDAAYWANYGGLTSTTGFAANVKLEIGRYSMWNELMYRVCNVNPDAILANQDGDANYKELSGGVQIGDNWAEMTYVDLNIYHVVGGNGTATWCQETCSGAPSNRVYRGSNRLAHSHRVAASTHVTVHMGWRPVLLQHH